MHFLTPEEFAAAVASFLGPFYVVLALMNVMAALWHWRGSRSGQALVWLLAALGYTILAAWSAGGGHPAKMPSIPQAIQTFVDDNTGPVVYSVGTTLILVVLFLFRRFFVQPAVAWGMLNLALLLLGLSMTNQDFYAIVAKPDNVPIVALVFLLGIFTWLAAYRAVQNDDRKQQGLPPLEKVDDEKVYGPIWFTRS
jgi:hypothetical protein